MLYVVEIDHGGRHKVWAARDGARFIEAAGAALSRFNIAAPGTMRECIEAHKAINAFFEVYDGPWAAVAAIKTGRVHSEAAEALEVLLERHRQVAHRGFQLGPGA